MNEKKEARVEGLTEVDWNDLPLFLAVAREGGLSRAAQSTGRSPATLGRRMHALERSLGRELFIRHDRGYDLTADGRELLASLSDIEPRIYRLSRTPASDGLPVVKVSAGTWTNLYLLQRIHRLTGTPPDTRLRFISAEEILDIAHREAVIGFRNQRPKDPALVCRRIMRVSFGAYATAEAPQRWIKVLADTPSARWLNRMADHQTICQVTAPRNSLDLALAGLGVAVLPTFIGDAQPLLQRRGELITELAHDQWLVTHQEYRHLPEIRRTLDRLEAAIQ